MMKLAWRLLALVAAVGSGTGALAQEHAKGYVAEPEELFKSFAVTPRYRAFLPPSVDLSAKFPRPGNQGKQSSCVGWAVAYALRSYYEGQRQQWDFSTSEQLMSPAFVYNRLRRLNEAPITDCFQGTSIARALELLKHEGAPTLAAFPYQEHDCVRTPDEPLLKTAAQFRIRDWRAIQPGALDDIKGQLAAGNPVVFGMNVSRSFDQLRGNAVYDDTDSPRTGGHAMVLVGYDEERQAFKLINSWGTGWGDGGFGWVSYRSVKELSNRLFVMDVDAAPTPAPAPAPAPAPVVVAPVVVTPPAPPPAPAPAAVVVAPPPPPSAPIAVVPPPIKPAAALSAEKLKQKADEWTARLSCARVEANVSASRDVTLRGFLGAAADLAKLEQDLRALPGAGTVQSQVVVHPWPQCEVFLNFADALQGRTGLSAQLRGASGKGAFKDQDSLSIEITTPPYPTYLYVTYLQASGEAAHLHWPQGRFPRPLAPNTKVVLGGGGAQPVYRVGKPFGEEIIVVVASASPLFREELPDTASDREYLTSFRKAFLSRPKDDSGARVVSAIALPLRTEP